MSDIGASMKPRITLIRSSTGELEIWINPEGRDLIVKELKHLDASSDHFHLGAEEYESEVPLQVVPYRDGDVIFESAKVMFRLDEWDAEYFPHVMK